MAPDGPSGPPAVPRDAATVMLVRDAEGLEVLLQRRAGGMAFAGGMTAFPGGGVDPRDGDGDIAVSSCWAGPPPSWWAERFACSTSLATALVCAAVRETFEECGVLLAGRDADSTVDDARNYHRERRALETRELSLTEFLTDAGLVLRADLLRPWANWLTPEAEPRRYDTRFFLAALPEGQRADDVTTEAVDAVWRTPGAALAEWAGGERFLLPPTWVALSELDAFADVGTALAEVRTINRIIPRLVRDGAVVRAVLPEDT